MIVSLCLVGVTLEHLYQLVNTLSVLLSFLILIDYLTAVTFESIVLANLHRGLIRLLFH
jgi:hypothetical protein